MPGGRNSDLNQAQRTLAVKSAAWVLRGEGDVEREEWPKRGPLCDGVGVPLVEPEGSRLAQSFPPTAHATTERLALSHDGTQSSGEIKL